MLAEQLAVRPKPRKSERVCIGLAVDQQQVRFDMAFAVSGPIAGKVVIPVAGIKGLIIR